jgi:hypothetical protein
MLEGRFAWVPFPASPVRSSARRFTLLVAAAAAAGRASPAAREASPEAHRDFCRHRGCWSFGLRPRSWRALARLQLWTGGRCVALRPIMESLNALRPGRDVASSRQLLRFGTFTALVVVLLQTELTPSRLSARSEPGSFWNPAPAYWDSGMAAPKAEALLLATRNPRRDGAFAGTKISP